MTEELPDTENESTLSSSALDWSVLFDKHYRNAFQTACEELSSAPTTDELQGAAALAFIATLRDSGIEDPSLVTIVGQAIWGPAKTKDNWTDEKSHRRVDLIDKMFQDTISIQERFELNSLTQNMRAALDTEENLPITGAKKLYTELLEMDDDE